MYVPCCRYCFFGLVQVRHVFVEAPKVDQTYTGIRMSSAVGEQNYIKGNSKFFAVAVSVSSWPYPLDSMRFLSFERRIELIIYIQTECMARKRALQSYILWGGNKQSLAKF